MMDGMTKVKNFIRGMGQGMDMTAIVGAPWRSPAARRSDVENMRGDWERVGRSLSNAVENVANDSKIKNP